jgi:DNA-directed RNA polymerase subunit alpha
MLNLKSVIVKSFSDHPVELTLSKKGGAVTAGDIKTTSDVEIVNPEQLIATIDDPKAELNISIVVESGRGYQTIEESTTKRLHSDMIALDAVFSPVRRVRYTVEKTRVGDNVDLDKLTLTVDTDGSIDPQAAFEQAAAILVAQYQALAGQTVVAAGETTPSNIGETDLLSLPVEELGLTARTTNALISNDIKTVNDLVSLTDEELADLKGFGSKAREEVKARVAELEF